MLINFPTKYSNNINFNKHNKYSINSYSKGNF